jgi:hypothetical protein
MDDLSRRKKEEDLIFQEIEEKKRLVEQAEAAEAVMWESALQSAARVVAKASRPPMTMEDAVVLVRRVMEAHRQWNTT